MVFDGICHPPGRGDDRPDHHVVGTVGLSLPGTEVAIVSPIDGQVDGEILLRGPHVMVGYYGDPGATSAALDASGWFRTGDLGRLSRDGSLRVTGRLKLSGKLSSGKYVSPEQVETLLTATGCIAHAVVMADARKFVTAIVSLDPDTIRVWADKTGVAGGYRDIVSDPRMRDMVAQVIESGVDARLERWEQVKQFIIAHEEFTVMNGYLTLSNKVIRHAVQHAYSGAVDTLYEE